MCRMKKKTGNGNKRQSYWGNGREEREGRKLTSKDQLKPVLMQKVLSELMTQNAWVRKSPWRRTQQPTPAFLPRESPGQRGLAGCSPRAHRVRHDWRDLAQHGILSIRNQFMRIPCEVTDVPTHMDWTPSQAGAGASPSGRLHQAGAMGKASPGEPLGVEPLTGWLVWIFHHRLQLSKHLTDKPLMPFMTDLWFSVFAEKIKDLFPKDSLDSSTVLVLVNAVYFKGQWNQKFKKESTVEEKFWLNKVLSVIYVYNKV